MTEFPQYRLRPAAILNTDAPPTTAMRRVNQTQALP
jgi:hypothetical protein